MTHATLILLGSTYDVARVYDPSGRCSFVNTVATQADFTILLKAWTVQESALDSLELKWLCNFLALVVAYTVVFGRFANAQLEADAMFPCSEGQQLQVNPAGKVKSLAAVWLFYNIKLSSLSLVRSCLEIELRTLRFSPWIMNPQPCRSVCLPCLALPHLVWLSVCLSTSMYISSDVGVCVCICAFVPLYTAST